MNKITKDMYVEDIVRDWPSSVAYLMERDIICIKCGAPVWGTLEELLSSRNVRDIDEFISAMNLFLASQS
ncbi:MAG: DUF1858 domain-containing protein [bacterium]|nr:DUF1858 domain-containing protein [bacterium]